MSAPRSGPVRNPSHAGSWYTKDSDDLARELDGYLNDVPDGDGGRDDVNVNSTRKKKPRALIAPHAGYSYSGPAAAWAYKTIDPKAVRRVFLLGPSHHVFLTQCALTKCSVYATPIGNLAIDLETYEKLKTENPDSFVAMTQTVDEDEHSLEMHLPYIARVFGNSDSRAVPPLVPILVGALSSKNEKKMGSILAPFLDDPCNLFIVSSDFCHWGKRFSYTRWAGQDGGVPLHTAIERLDKEGIEHIVNKDADGFCAYIERTKNTICGRHPIGVLLRALESSQNFSDRHVELLRYEQSSQAVTRSDSSVSYASAVVY